MTANAQDLAARLRQIAAASPWMMAALQAVRELGLPHWCIGAGAVRNLVWDHLHGLAVPSALADVDVAYFDASPWQPADDLAWQQRLQASLPGVPWEVTNQAWVHTWFEAHFGHAVPPLTSLEDAVASWPETASAVGLSLSPAGQVQVIAPLGLDDLFALRVRRNARRVSVHTYRQRVASKRYDQRWPRVTVELA